MHETKAKVERLCKMKHTLMSAVEAELAKGIEGINTKELGEAIDMIKDLAEAEEKLYKACYYKEIVEAMDEAEEEEEMHLKMLALEEYEGGVREGRMGYNPNRTVHGRYARSGGDRTMGHMGRHGYPSDYRTGPMDHAPVRDVTRSGYPMDHHMPHDPDMMPMYMDGDVHYGKPYHDYKIYRRNYTASKSMEDKAEMDKHAMTHVHESIDTIKDIWKDADPELKRKMKSDFTKLVNDMN